MRDENAITLILPQYNNRDEILGTEITIFDCLAEQVR